jgi:hypothetical protein
MDGLSTFVNDISAFEINLPLWLQSVIILVIILVMVVGGYFLRDTFDISYLKNGYTWFIVIAVINLITIFAIFTFYAKKAGNYIGPRGRRGRSGKRGKTGTSVSCSYECKNNIYIKSLRKTDTICRLDSYNQAFKTVNDNYNYFQDILDEGNTIEYSGIIDNILLNKPLDSKSTLNLDAINKFKSLMSATSIALCLIKSINKDTTSSSELTYGTFRSVVPSIGYLSIGDSVYGGVETFGLNSFVVSGDIMYPAGYSKLTSITAFNALTGDEDVFTLWRPDSQSVPDKDFDNKPIQSKYLPLGDICYFGNNPPRLNDFAMIKETCLEPVSALELKLVFIYTGNIIFNDYQNTEQYIQSNSYLIENKIDNTIEIFSVWRTPMNTFITNNNTQNDLVNNTLIFNVLGNLDEALNEYGNISTQYKSWMSELLTSISIPSILTSMIYTRHFQLECSKEIIYYMNKYQAQVPEFKGKNIANMSIAELMKLIDDTNTAYKKFNDNLIKQASISLRATKPLVYDSKKEKYLPPTIITTYNQIQGLLDTIPIKVENTDNLLDIVNTIIPNGIESRIAVDSNGIAQGGIILNEVQETIVRICKILVPPPNSAYIIKDECLGTFSLDKDKNNKIKELTNEREKYNKLIDTISTNYDKFQSQQEMIRNYEDLAMKKIGLLVGYISNYMEKIKNMDMEEFTTSRIKGLIEIYKETNKFFEGIINNTP